MHVVREALGASPCPHAGRAVDTLPLQTRKPRPWCAAQLARVAGSRRSPIQAPKSGLLGQLRCCQGGGLAAGWGGGVVRRRFWRLQGRHSVASSPPRALVAVVTRTLPQPPPSRSSRPRQETHERPEVVTAAIHVGHAGGRTRGETEGRRRNQGRHPGEDGTRAETRRMGREKAGEDWAWARAGGGEEATMVQAQSRPPKVTCRSPQMGQDLEAGSLRRRSS